MRLHQRCRRSELLGGKASVNSCFKNKHLNVQVEVHEWIGHAMSPTKIDSQDFRVIFGRLIAEQSLVDLLTIRAKARFRNATVKMVAISFIRWRRVQSNS